MSTDKTSRKPMLLYIPNLGHEDCGLPTGFLSGIDVRGCSCLDEDSYKPEYSATFEDVFNIKVLSQPHMQNFQYFIDRWLSLCLMCVVPGQLANDQYSYLGFTELMKEKSRLDELIEEQIDENTPIRDPESEDEFYAWFDHPLQKRIDEIFDELQPYICYSAGIQIARYIRGKGSRLPIIAYADDFTESIDHLSDESNEMIRNVGPDKLFEFVVPINETQSGYPSIPQIKPEEYMLSECMRLLGIDVNKFFVKRNHSNSL